jgi:hypothetical protein
MAAVLQKDRFRTAAMEAKTYVKTRLYFGASNDWKFYWDASKGGLPGLAWAGVALESHLLLQGTVLFDSRSKGRAAEKAGRPYLKGSRRLTQALLDIWAKDGLRYGCGNCGVQSAVAFVRLRDHWKVFPLDWVQVKGGDHGFVVVGRDKKTDPSNPATWNEEAVICDPWRGIVQMARACSAIRGLVLELMYRQESVTDLPND